MKTSLCAPCCVNPCDVAPTLIAMGLAPMEAASSCNGINPQNGSQLIGCTPGVPCCGPISLATFLNGNVSPIPANTVRFSNGGSITYPFNTAILATPADLLAYLNTEVIPYALLQGQSVEGSGSTFSIQGGTVLIAPKIGGSCAIRLLNRQQTIEPANTLLTVLVASEEGVVPGDILAPVSFTGQDEDLRRRRPVKLIASALPAGSEVIATRARALVLPPGEQPPAASDGWLVAAPGGYIERGVVPGFDRVPVKVPGDSFLVEDLGSSARRVDWEGLRNPNTGSATGAYVGSSPGRPINGPASVVEPGGFSPGDAVLSPRVAVPIDCRVADGRGGVVMKAGFQLLAPTLAASVSIVGGLVNVAQPPAAPSLAPSPLAPSPAAPAAKATK